MNSNSSLAFEEWQAMEYRDFEYHVVPTSNPPGWKWTVFVDAYRTRTGHSPTRAHAVLDAERTIDKIVSIEEK